MKCVQSSENGVGVFAKGLVDLNEPEENDKKAVGIRDVREGQGPSNEDVPGANKNIMGANCRPSGNMIHPPADAHSRRAQPQGQSVCWERFLPVRSLKVLLVESDDSTRHVVSALLRNCSYEVTAVSNGIEAWKILADLDNQIDLVLTEVVMSGLSGVGLLSKIMTHKSCRNIPVIMMSCYDSMGIVLKCLSKGAADFLVKPIRKNELKNLWQHVWRRCHSSSGSGSESGVGNEKSMTEKSAYESDNNTGSNNEDDSRSFGLQGRNGSDNGSGTQSSWTKKAAEVDSPQPLSLRGQLSDPPDSTCGHVTYPRSEAFASSWLPASMDECRGQENQHESQQKAPSIKASVTETKENQSPQPDLNQKNDGGNTDKKLEISNDKPKGNRIRQAVNISGDIICTEIHSRGSPGSGMPDVFPEIHRNKDNFVVDIQKQPSLELSLNRLGDRAEASINVSEQNILRHSELSAFTRYNTCSTVNQGLTGNVGSCSPADNSAERAKKPNSDSTPNQNSNSGSNNNDMGSTTNRSFTKPDKAPEKSILKLSHQTLAFKPEKRSPTFNSAPVASSKTNPEVVNVKLQENDLCTKTDDFFIESMNEKVIEGGPLNGKAAPNEAKGIYCSLNGSVCGSNQGTNAQNGGSSAVKADGITMAHGSGVAAVDCTGNGSGSGSGVGMDQSRSAIREAALSKFRQKRKERCFDKKVRYQSRKKLAEQRPRVRGQFVRHVHDSKGEDADS